MNIQLLVAGILTLLDAIVHVIGGEITDIKHLIRSDIPTNLKVELRMSWYLVAIDMTASGIYILLVVADMAMANGFLLGFIALRFFLYGVSALMQLLFTQRDHLFKVPQWALLIVIGIVTWWGI